MAKASPEITSFTSGELSPRLEGRVDIPKYFSGSKKLENLVIHPHGGATRRPGTKFITEVQDSTKKHRLLPFEFNVEQTYALEFGDEEVRVITNDGVVQDPAERTYDLTEFSNLQPNYGITDINEKTEIQFSNDGLTFFNIQYKEDFANNRIDITFDQFALTQAYAIETAGIPLRRYIRVPYSSAPGFAAGQPLHHIGCFFSQKTSPPASSNTTPGLLQTEGSSLYIWLGIPEHDLETIASVVDWRMWRIDLDAVFDLTGKLGSTETSSITSSSFYDEAYIFQSSQVRRPIPVTGVALVPEFDTLLRSDATTAVNGTYSAASDISTPDSVLFNGGQFLVCAVSHLISGSAFYEGGVGNQPVEPGTLIVSWMQDTDTQQNGAGYGINDNDAGWSSISTSSAIDRRTGSNVSINQINRLEDFKDILSSSDIIVGLQIRSMRDYWIMDTNQKLWHEVYPNTDTGTKNQTDHGLGVGQLGTDAYHTGNHYVLYITTLHCDNTSDTSAELNLYAIPFRFNNSTDIDDLLDEGTTKASHVGISAAMHLTDATFDITNGASNTPKTAKVANNPKRAFVTFDGKQVWYHKGVTTYGTDANIAARKKFKFPYLIMNLDDSIPNITSSQSALFIGETLTNSGNTKIDVEQSDALGVISDLKISVPYGSSDLDGIRFSQSADILYLAHPNYPVQKIVRYGAVAWTCEEVSFTRGPMQDVGFYSNSLLASGRTGTVTVTSQEGGIFASTDVGRLIKVHDGFAKITEFTSPSRVSAEVVENADGRSELMPSYTATTISAHEGDPSSTGLEHNDRYQDSDGNFISQGFKAGMKISVTGFTDSNNNETSALIVKVTEDTILIAPSGDLTTESAGDSITFNGVLEADEDFQLGAWSQTTGYPSAIAFYEQRLVFANTLTQPQTLFFSVAGSYEEFTGGTNADDAMIYTIGSSQVNVIEYLAGSRYLVVGTSGGEFVVSSGGVAEPLSPTNTQIRRQANYGSAAIQPVTVANVILFVQRAGRKLRELTYNYDTDSYFAPDMTILSEHITESGIDRIAFQQEPDNIVWCVLKDGSLVGMTYRREEEVVGWHAHTLGGTDVAVEDVMTLPTTLNEDELYMIVKRTINGSTKRYIEKLTNIDFGNDVKDAWHVDSGLQYSGSATTSITGLDHLEGETVEILADGFAVSGKTVSSGGITLDTAASKATIGLPFTSTLQTMRIDAGGTEGTSQGKTKRIRDVTFRFFNTVAADVGPSEQNLDPISFRDSNLAATTPTPLFSGDKDITFPSGYDSDGFIVIKQDQALPLTILAIFPRLQTFDR